MINRHTILAIILLLLASVTSLFSQNLSGTDIKSSKIEAISEKSLASVDDVLADVSAGLDVADEILDEVGDLANDILDNGPFSDSVEVAMETYTVEKYREDAAAALSAAVSALANGGATTENISDAATKLAQATALKNRANKLENIYNNSDTLNIIAVEFYENLTQFNGNKMGLDISKYEAHRLHYNIMVLPDGNVKVPWVATKAGDGGSVKAKFLPNDSVKVADILFKSGADGATLSAQLSGNEWTITLPSIAKEESLVVNAVDKNGATVGKLNAIGYEELKRKVHIVPVGTSAADFTGSELTNYLNRIYAQAGATWEVEMEEAIAVDGYNGTLQDDKQALLSTYSDGMKAIIKSYKNSENVTVIDNEFYLFLVDKSQTNKAGYMPRKHQYGFIYMGESGDKQRTIAHELSHGAFRLQHPWEEYPSITEGSTNNLMDYGSGTHLRKYQWDLIHNPPVVVGLVEDLDEGSSGSYTSNGMLIRDEKTSNLLLGQNQISLKYEIKDFDKIINSIGNGFSIKKEDYVVSFIVVNNQSQIVYFSSNTLQEGKNNIEWNGKDVLGSEIINFENYKSFKYHVGVMPLQVPLNIIDWDYSQGSRPHTTPVENLVSGKHFLFADLLIELDIQVDKAWKDWLEVSDEAKKLVSGSFKAYKKFNDELGNTQKGVGEFFDDIDNPLKYLSDNTVEIEFLNSTFRVFKSFAPKLEYVKEKLGEARMTEIAETCTYTLGVGIRFKKGGNGLSMHSFGTVVDIYPKANIFLKPYNAGKGEKEMVILIKQVTNLDLASHEFRTPNKITEAQRQFLNEFGNQKMTFDRLISLYGSIDSYNASENAYNFKDLNSNIFYDELFDAQVAAEAGFFEELPEYLSKIQRLNSFLNEMHGDYSPLEAVVYSENGREELRSLKYKIQQLYFKLSPLYEQQASNSLKGEIFSDISLGEFKELAVTQLSKEYGVFFDLINSGYGKSFNNFALELKKWNDAPVGENFGNELFKDGFCNVPLDLIDAFREQSDIKWGGMDWNGSNIDYMHFEINESKTVEYLKKL